MRDEVELDDLFESAADAMLDKLMSCLRELLPRFLLKKIICTVVVFLMSAFTHDRDSNPGTSSSHEVR